MNNDSYKISYKRDLHHIHFNPKGDFVRIENKD